MFRHLIPPLPIDFFQSNYQVLNARPELASATGLFDSLSAMHRAAAGGHLGVLRAVVEALRAYGSHVADPSKADHKVRFMQSLCRLISCGTSPDTISDRIARAIEKRQWCMAYSLQRCRNVPQRPVSIPSRLSWLSSLQGRTFASVERFLGEVINHRASRGQTPLMLACANGCARKRLRHAFKQCQKQDIHCTQQPERLHMATSGFPNGAESEMVRKPAWTRTDPSSTGLLLLQAPGVRAVPAV